MIKQLTIDSLEYTGDNLDAVNKFVGMSYLVVDQQHELFVDPIKQQAIQCVISAGDMICKLPDNHIHVIRKYKPSAVKPIQSFASFQVLWKFPNEFQRQDLQELIDEYSDDLVNAAIKLAGSKDVPKNRAINFLNACVKEWSNANVKTVDQAREYQKVRIAEKNNLKQKFVREEILPDRFRSDVSNSHDVDPAKLKKFQEKINSYLGDKQ
jgi:DnaD/phage-associated family protein